MKKIIILIFLFLTSLVAAQENSLEDKDFFNSGFSFKNPDAVLLAKLSGVFDLEDPTSIFDFKVSDKEVELLIDGSWDIFFLSKASLLFTQDARYLSFSPFVFTQSVNLDSYLMLDQSWYFESSFAENFTKNTLAVGFIGDEQNPVKHVRIGNSNIVFPGTYPFIQSSNGGLSPGIMATFASPFLLDKEGANIDKPRWQADAMIRYDAIQKKEKNLVGSSEITQTKTGMSEWIYGKWFVLPEAPISNTIQVFVESPIGNLVDSKGRKWKELNPLEYKFSGITGIVELTNATQNAIAIFYESVNRIAKTQEFITETIEYFGGNSSIAVEEGWIEKKEDVNNSDLIKNKYFIEIGGKECLLVNTSAQFSPFMLASRYQGSSHGASLVHENTGIQDKKYSLVIFDENISEIINSKYLGSVSINPRWPQARFPMYHDYPNLYFPSLGGSLLDTDLVIQSTHAAVSDTIFLSADVLPGSVRVFRNGFQEANFSFNIETGIITFNETLNPTDSIKITWQELATSQRNANLVLASGFLVNLQNTSFSLGMNLSWNISKTGFTDFNEQSPGSFLIGAGIQSENKNNKLQTKIETKTALNLTTTDTTGLYRVKGMDSNQSRYISEASWYKLLAENTKLVLGKPENETPIELSPEYYINPIGFVGDRIPTVTDSSMEGAILHLAASLEKNAWTAITILEKNTSFDLRFAEELTLYLKKAPDNSNYELYLQVLNDTSIYEDADKTLTWKLSPLGVTNNWINHNIRLSKEDRKKISSSSKLRLIAYNPNVAPAHVDVYSGAIEVQHLSWAESINTSMHGSIKSRAIKEATDKKLIHQYPNTVGRFNPSGTNTVLEVTIKPDVTKQDFEIAQYQNSIPLNSYNSFSFFIFGPSFSQESSIVVKLTGSDENGNIIDALKLTLRSDDINPNDWNYISVLLKSKSLLINENPIPKDSSDIFIDTRINPTRIALGFNNWLTTEDTIFYFDEFFLQTAENVFQIINETKVDLRYQGSLFKIFKTAIIGSPFLSVEATSTYLTNTEKLSINGSAETGLNLIGTNLNAKAQVTYTEKPLIEQTSYKIIFPFKPIIAEEYFSANLSSGSWSRIDTFKFTSPLTFSLSTSSKADSKNKNQKISSSFLINTKPNLELIIEAEQTLNQTAEKKVNTNTYSNYNYKTLWHDSFDTSTSFGEEEALQRTGQISLSSLYPKVYKSRLSFFSSYNYATRTEQKGKTSFYLAFPLEYQSFKIEPSWQRTAQVTQAKSVGGSYQSDFQYINEVNKILLPLYTQIPVTDIFSTKLPAKIQNTSSSPISYENIYSLSFRRSLYGLFSDLFIPSTTTLSIKRQIDTDEASNNYRDVVSLPIRLGFISFNIAGEFSNLKLFTWYEQDEITQFYNFVPLWDAFGYSWSMDTLHSILLYFKNQGSLSLDNYYKYEKLAKNNSVKTKDALKLIWKRPSSFNYAEQKLSSLTKMQTSTKREDSLSYQIEYAATITKSIQYQHSLKFQIGTNGEVRFDFGSGIENIKDKQTRIDLSFGLGGTLRY